MNKECDGCCYRRTCNHDPEKCCYLARREGIIGNKPSFIDLQK